MEEVIQQFRSNIGRIRQNLAAYPAIKGAVGVSADMTDFLRGELVACISCFDHYIHELVRLGALEVLRGDRPQTQQFNAFQVTLGGVTTILSGADPAVWLESEVRQKNSWRSFQRDDKVAEAIRVIHAGNIWNDIAIRMNRKASDLCVQLNAISDRRNQIVHEYDLNPAIPGARWPINERLVSDAVDFISIIGEHIVQIVRTA